MLDVDASPVARPSPRTQLSPSPTKAALRYLIESGCTPINITAGGSIRVGKVARGVSTFWVAADLAEKICGGAHKIIGARSDVATSTAALYESARELRTRLTEHGVAVERAEQLVDRLENSTPRFEGPGSSKNLRGSTARASVGCGRERRRLHELSNCRAAIAARVDQGPGL